MSEQFTTDLALRLHGPWVVPVFGAAVAALALLLFRLFFAANPRLVAVPSKARRSLASDPFLEGSFRERRSAPRRSGNEVDVELDDPDEVLPPLPAWVVDRSVGGLRLSVECPVAEGKVLRVRARGPAARWVPIEVRSCQPNGNRWEVGCQFLKNPSYVVLITFG
jgi:hypothetical protein